jgi:crossover junction endodeoxyribonuclease RuvC
MSIILWIDPGTTTIWFALIEKVKNNFELLDYWIVETPPKMELKYKLLEIWTDIWELLDAHKPDLVSIEKLFFTTNIKTW